MNIAITGTSRGIGLELSHQALERGDRVMAFARKPQQAPDLQRLKEKFGDLLQLQELDVTHPDAPAQAARAVSSWPNLDILINNAGIYREGETAEDFIESFRVNSVAPFLITKALFPKLKASPHPKAIQISSLMGSIQDNTSGDSYAYRSSKAALNMITKTLAVSEKWLIAAAMHPGWVQTRMGGSQAPTSPTDSARGLWRVILKFTDKETGSFYDFEGEHLPW